MIMKSFRVCIRIRTTKNGGHLQGHPPYAFMRKTRKLFFFIRFLRLYDLPAVVITASRAKSVRQLHGMALRALRYAGHGKLICCRPSCISALFGCSSLWYRHLSTPPRHHTVWQDPQKGLPHPPPRANSRILQGIYRSGCKALCNPAYRETAWAD